MKMRSATLQTIDSMARHRVVVAVGSLAEHSSLMWRVTTARSGANHLSSVANFRRSTSKKLKIKLTLLFGPDWLSVSGAFSTAKRLPSGCTSKLGKTPTSVNWPADQSCGLSAWKESPEALYVATMILLSGQRVR